MQRTTYSWVAFALISAASFAGMAACVRLASESLPQSELVFFRNFMALLMLLVLLRHQNVNLKTSHFRLHLLRAGAGLGAMYFYFYALAHLPLSDALLLNYTSPLFIAVIAVLWLKERWTKARITALLLGFAGVSLLFTPGSAIASTAGLAGLASGALAGLALATVKRMAGQEPPIRIVTWFALLASLISLFPMLLEFRWPTGDTWLWLIAVGVLANAGQLCLTMAYARAAAIQVSPLGYTGLLFAGVLGYLVWQELPTTAGVMGSLLIILAGITVARERSEPMPEPPGSVPPVGEKP